jgi:hypothetical protein
LHVPGDEGVLRLKAVVEFRSRLISTK